MQLSGAQYATTEGLTFTTITVTRTGDTSGASSVDYEVNDGSATQKVNFTYATGTLNFAAGQTSQTFVVLLNENGYFQGDLVATIQLSNPVNAGLGNPSNATLVIHDNDAQDSATNPIDDPNTFVGQHYHDFLNRQSDSDGQAFWVNQLTQCGADQNCTDGRRVSVSKAFFLSVEFQQTGYLVHRIAVESFATLPRYKTFLRDTQRIQRGIVVGQGNWQTQLEANKQQFANDWVQRSDFRAKYDGMSNSDYVDALYRNSGVDPTQAQDRNALVNGLNNGSETRATVLRKVADSKEVYNAQYNSAFVLMQYFGYLRRNPDDAPDNNLNGYNFWLKKMNDASIAGEDMRDEPTARNREARAQMVRSFIVSREYRQRFGKN